jgi:hypothetical protein
MEASMSTKELEQLGNNLVEEYGLEDSGNTLERWMLHYLAELFEQEKICNDENCKQKIQMEIKEITLEFWRLRYCLADEKSLFNKNQNLINTLERISPKSIIPFSPLYSPYNQKPQNNFRTEWQDKLVAIDQATKILMSHCILKDFEGIADRNEEIVELMKVAESIKSSESILSQFFADERAEEKKVENIEERIQDLKVFIATAESALEEYQVELSLSKEKLASKEE